MVKSSDKNRPSIADENAGDTTDRPSPDPINNSSSVSSTSTADPGENTDSRANPGTSQQKIAAKKHALNEAKPADFDETVLDKEQKAQDREQKALAERSSAKIGLGSDDFRRSTDQFEPPEMNQATRDSNTAIVQSTENAESVKLELFSNRFDPPDAQDKALEINARDDGSISSLASLVSLASLRNSAAYAESEIRATALNADAASGRAPARRLLDNSIALSHLLQRTRHTVTRGERRGLLARLVIIPEYDDARDYSSRIKFLITFVVASAAVTGPMGTSIIFPALNNVAETFHTSTSIVNVSTGVYILSLGIFPLWWSALSENFGRRSIYIISFAMFVVFSIGTSLAPSIAALIILRMFQGGASASVQAVGAGTISDLFAPHERGRAMGYYWLGPLCGPFLAPIVGGALAQRWEWRATQWFLVILSAANLILMVLLLPETLRSGDNLAALQEMLNKDADSASSTPPDLMNHEELKEPANGSSASPHKHFATLTEKTQSRPKSIDSLSYRHKSIDSLPPDLERIASNLTRYGTRDSRPVLRDEEEGPVMDPLYPVISRAATNQTSYSRKVALEIMNEEYIKASEPSRAPSASTSHWLYEMLVRPTRSLLLLSYPPLLLAIAYSAVNFGIIYFMNLTIAHSYASAPYHFRDIIVGLMYLPNSVTYVITSVVGGRWNDHLLRKYMKLHNGDMTPDSRLSWNIVVAIVLYIPACLIFGWTLRYGTMWALPLVGSALLGVAGMLIIGLTLTYIVDSLPGKGATGVALNNLVRQVLAAIATFVTEPLIEAIGEGVLFSILMGVLLVSSVLMYILKQRGDYFREHYNVGKLYDKL